MYMKKSFEQKQRTKNKANMPKTKLVISQSGAAATADKGKELGSSPTVQDDLDWKKYAQLLRKENNKQEKKIKLYQTGKKKPAKRVVNVGPPSDKQILSRGEFKKRVAEAQALYQKGASGRKWKDCMSQVYQEARDRKEKERLEKL